MADETSSGDRTLVILSVVGCGVLLVLSLCLVVPLVFLGFAATSQLHVESERAEARRAEHAVRALVQAAEAEAGRLELRPVLDAEGSLLGDVLISCRPARADLVVEAGVPRVHVHLAEEDAARLALAAGATPGAALRVELNGARVAELAPGADLASGLLVLDATDLARARELLRAAATIADP